MNLTLHLVRHGHTLYTGRKGPDGRLDSHIVAGVTDVALSAEGEAAARVLGRQLVPKLAQFEFHSSNLQRAVKTAELLGGKNINQDSRLSELNFGEWEGLSWEDVHQQFPNELAAWSDDWVNIRPPSGESFAEMATRAKDWLQSQPNDQNAKNHKRELIVCAHSGLIRALLCSALNLPLHHAMKFSIDYVHITTLEIAGDSTGCLRVNSHSF